MSHLRTVISKGINAGYCFPFTWSLDGNRSKILLSRKVQFRESILSFMYSGFLLIFYNSLLFCNSPIFENALIVK